MFSHRANLDLGLPHRLMEDDVYDGFLIPKGSLVSDYLVHSVLLGSQPDRCLQISGKSLHSTISSITSYWHEGKCRETQDSMPILTSSYQIDFWNPME